MDARTVVALAAVLAVAVGFGVHHFWTGRPRTIAAPPARRRPSVPLEPAARVRPYVSASPAQVVVDVTGKVRHPGLRRLPTGARVADALTAAGGALPGTDTGALNLARVLVDGEQVVVGPARGAAGALAAGGAAGAGAASGVGAAAGAAAGPVSLNSATLEQLETLPGVGPVLAQRIVDYRVKHGPFASADRLGDVPGIGDRRLAELKPLVTP
jgi:competence protein ComEA